jgi:hypothetical protein
MRRILNSNVAPCISVYSIGNCFSCFFISLDTLFLILGVFSLHFVDLISELLGLISPHVYRFLF